MTESKSIQPFDVPKISCDPLDSVKVGDWYWLKIEDEEWDQKTGKRIKKGEHEELYCVSEIGSNYVGFEIGVEHGTDDCRIHFDKFFAKTRPEPNWKEILQKKMVELQAAIQEKTKELVEHGQKLYLLPQLVEAKKEEPGCLLPAKVSDEHKKHKKALVAFRDKRMPTISKEIGELACEFAVTAKNMALPDLLKLKNVKKALGVVEDRIFTIELYCGLQEEVRQIADGDPAPATEKIAIRQMLLFMDEETLFDYEEGGMDFKKIPDFDKWVVKPENLSRILPEPKGIVAFQVRRHEKDYGTPSSLLEAWTHMEFDLANKFTYLLIRNGQRVYRIASEIDFSPRLIPMRNEIGEAQFKVINERWVYDKKDPFKKVQEVEMITPESVKFDDHVAQVDALLKQYNRIVILIQGLLDRSHVFHPHPPIKLTIPGVLDQWIRLIRDEEDGLPSNKVTFEEYQKQINSTLRKGKWVYVDSKYNEKYKNGETPYRDSSSRYRQPPRRGWAVNGMPDICQVDSMKRDGSAVRVSWPWGQRSKPKEGAWVPNPKRPGYGHYETIYETDRMCHEWIPVNRVMNVSDYNAGDYKMFLCDHALKGKYLEWTQYLLIAEDWCRKRASGMKPEEDPRAQVRRGY